MLSQLNNKLFEVQCLTLPLLQVIYDVDSSAGLSLLVVVILTQL